MNSAEKRELEQKEKGIGKLLKRLVRPPAKTPPQPETLQGWADSSIRGRNKS
jgi:hypothetical protein